MNKSKSLAVFALLALAPMCFAPIEDKPTGAQFHGELTEQQLNAAQGGSVTEATPSGGSSTIDTPRTQIDAPGTNDAASQVVAGAQADSVLKRAQNEVKDKEASKSRPFVVVGFTVLAVGLALFGGKMWLDKSVPGK